MQVIRGVLVRVAGTGVLIIGEAESGEFAGAGFDRVGPSTGSGRCH